MARFQRFPGVADAFTSVADALMSGFRPCEDDPHIDGNFALERRS